MKSGHFAVSLLIVCISCAEALRCWRCVPKKPGWLCIDEVETCQGRNEICVTLVFTYHKSQCYRQRGGDDDLGQCSRVRDSYLKRCMDERQAFILKTMNQNNFKAITCSTDLCN